MRSFSNVQENNANRILNEKKVKADSQRVELLSAIKKTYGISNFKTLSESEKSVYRNMINEMWDSVEGLNERGLKFVNESEITLSKNSERDEIIKFITQEFNKNLFGYFEGITGKRFTGGSNPISPKALRDEVEKAVGKKYDPKNFKRIFKERINELIDKSDMF